jgi:hypothetical protein
LRQLCCASPSSLSASKGQWARLYAIGHHRGHHLGHHPHAQAADRGTRGIRFELSRISAPSPCRGAFRSSIAILEQTLAAAGIRYVWAKGLGGYRNKTLDDSPNIALRNQSFRNYADSMLTPEFGQAVVELTTLAENSRSADTRAERLYFPLPPRAGLRPGRSRTDTKYCISTPRAPSNRTL